MKKILVIIVLAGCAVLNSCHSLESVEPVDRNTWMYFYGGLGNYTAVAGQQTPDGGFILVGDSIAPSNQGITVIKTDKHGKKEWRLDIPKGSASGINVTSTGYFIIGSGIYIDLSQQVVKLQVRSQMRLLELTSDGSIAKDLLIGNLSGTTNYNGNAVTSNDSLVYVISDQKKVSTDVTATNYLTTKISVFHKNNLSLKDSANYNYDNRDEVNSRVVHITPQGDILWGVSAQLLNGTATRSFIRLPALGNNTFKDGDSYGNPADNYQIGDVQPGLFDYGVIGTYATATGTNANIFFTRTFDKNNYALNPTAILYLDGAVLQSTGAIQSDKDVSTSDDAGLALTSATDGGYILACSTTSAVTGKDILLVHIDVSNKVTWHKIIGGSGDETVSSIHTTSDGALIISGTLDLAGLKSMFLLKTNANGELKD